MNANTKRSIWAVVAGVVAIIVISTVVDIVLHAVHVFPPMNQPINDAQALLATVYRVIIGVGAAYLTASLAPDRPMRHAMILGYIGLYLALVGVIATWNMALGPRWYPIALVVLAIPQCWAGARIWEMKASNRGSR